MLENLASRSYKYQLERGEIKGKNFGFSDVLSRLFVAINHKPFKGLGMEDRTGVELLYTVN